MSSSDKSIPSTPQRWTTMVKDAGLEGKNIYEEQLSSASKITQRHFLLFRVLRKPVNLSKFDPKQFDLDKWIQPAKDLLNEYHSWKAYKESFKGMNCEGNFFPVKISQIKAAEVKSDDISDNIILSPVSGHIQQRSRESLVPEGIRGEMHPEVDEEWIVKAAAIEFLRALTDQFSLSSYWTIHGKAFKAQFGNTQYETSTHGYLRDRESTDVRGLVEVKAPRRYTKQNEIRMQESAQMVAWLKQYPHTPRNLPYRRFHVLQDRHEIWLNFAEYDDQYLKYLEGTSTSTDPTSFLVMHEIGPFSTQVEQHMVALGPILLALTLRADHDREEEQRSVLTTVD